jgi:hypothetical protein
MAIVIILILLASLAESAIVNYGTYNNYIPSYTYPFTLNAGDTISQNLSWANSEDLDIYLYRQGQDLLNRDVRVDR